MSVIRIIKNESGMMLLNILFFILFLGIMATSITTMVIADYKMQSVNLARPRALYAAESGVEYALRGVMEYAVANSSLGGLHGYNETIDAGGGTEAEITLSVIGSDSLLITSVGRTANFSQTVTKGINYIDVSNYAIYATGSISKVSTSGGGLGRRANATHMPKFELEELRNMARPLHYFPGNLTINSPFTFVNNMAFVENDLTVNNYNFSFLSGVIGTFVAGRNITLNSTIISFYNGVFYQPNPASFRALGGYRLYYIDGGLIVNGNVTGKKYFFNIFKNTLVHYNRTRINSFMQYSVNGGPLVVFNSRWSRQH